MDKAYMGPERRSSPDTLMLMDEIHKVAMVAGTTSENVRLLREDWNSSKLSFITCDDLDRVEKKVDSNTQALKDHESKHIDSKRWTIGTMIAALAIFISGIGLYIGRGVSWR